MSIPQKANLRQTIFTATVVALSACASIAQGSRPTAITHARIVTMEGKTIEMGTVLIRHGKIQAVGAKVKVPPGARIIDAKGGTVMPGLVSAYSRAGLSGARRATPTITIGGRRRGRRPFGGARQSTGPGRNSAAKKVALAIYPRQKVFHELLESGGTTVALAPTGTGFPGQGALLDLTGKTRDKLVVDDTAFLAVNPANNTKTKKLLKETFEKAKKLVAERKKPKTPVKPVKKTPAKTPAKTPTKKPTEKKGTGTPPKPVPTPPKPTPKPPKPTPKPPKPKPSDGGKTGAKSTAKTPAKKPPAKKKKDPNMEVLADLLEGKQRAFIGLSSATDVLHYIDAVGDTRFTATILATSMSPNRGTLDLVLDKVKSLKAAILMNPKLATKPYTDHLTNPAATLHKAGIKIGFIVGDSKQNTKTLFTNLINLVRHGLDPDVALKAVTIVPAEMLGIAKDVGSIKVGKDANLILFDGDPLDPITTLKKVWYKGQVVEKEKER